MAKIDNALVRMQQLDERAATGSYSSAQRSIMDNELNETPRGQAQNKKRTSLIKQLL